MQVNKYGPICILLQEVIQPLSNVSIFRQILCYFYDLALQYIEIVDSDNFSSFFFII